MVGVTIPIRNIPRFNKQGLWSFDSEWFSRYGSLLNTLEHFINESVEGFLGLGLKELLHVEVIASLLKLLKQGRVSREKSLRLYFYFSKNCPSNSVKLLSAKQIMLAWEHVLLLWAPIGYLMK